MNFNSGTERPHQPVRIYDLHLGRCGEHEDITAAAARASLIPCRCIEAYSSDHVWNEFWDEKWWQWEPVNFSIRDNFVYSKGWGKKFGTILARQSTGGAEQVTDDYVESTASLSVYAVENNGKPLDGAVIMLAARKTLDETSLFIDSYGVTDNEGKYSFTVSAGREYYGRVDSPLGSNPTTSGQVVPILMNPEESGEYEYTLKIGGVISDSKFKILPNRDPTIDYMADVRYKTQKQVLNWRLLFNDLGGEYTYDNSLGAEIYSFICDETNFKQAGQNMKYDVSSLDLSSAGEYSFNIPADKNWYFLLNNSNSYSNLVHASGTYRLFASTTMGIEQNSGSQMVLSQNYPNPFNKTTEIGLNIEEPGFYRLSIFNSQGELIRNLAEGQFNTEKYSFIWDGTDSTGNLMPSGAYFYRLESRDRFDNKIMILIR